MLLQEERELIVEYGKQMSAQGLSKGTSGNISIYDKESDLMVISPSGIGYFDTKPEDVVVMKLDGTIVESDRRPSSEWGLHAAFYKEKPETGAVVHTHSTFCTTFACLNQSIKSVHYVIGGAGVTEIPVAPYGTFGTDELAKSAIEACGESKAVLLANHGLVASGINLKKAFSLAVNIEFVAEMQYRTMCVGQPVILTDEQMRASMERSKTYGQR